MMIAIAFFAAAAILCRASAENVSTSLLLPNLFFYFDQSFKPPTFVGQVTVIMSTTYYTLDCSAGGAATYFTPVYDCETSGGSYTFSETSATTQYVYDTIEDSLGIGAASTSEDEATQIETINCGPLGISSSAACTTTFESEDSTSIGYSSTYATGTESSTYKVFFSTAVGYKTASSTSALPSPTTSGTTAKSTSTSSPKTSSLSPSSKIGIALGVPLGACALAALALLLYRHTKHKQLSRKDQMGNLPAPPPAAFAAESNDAKRVSEAGMGRETMVGREPPVYSMEMQG